MPKISLEIKKQIAAISKTELEKIVIKMAGKDKAAFDYLLVNYLEKETGENELFEEAKTIRRKAQPLPGYFYTAHQIT